MPDTARPAGIQQQQSSRLGVARRLDKERQLGGWRGPQVCAIVGITYRQLDYWARTDLVRPSLAVAKGSGTVRRYSHADLVTLAVIRALLDAGISLQSARRAIAHLGDTDIDDLAAANLVITGTDTLLATSGEQITHLLKNTGGVLNILPLARVLDEIDTAIADLDGDTNTPAPTTDTPLETT